MDELDIQNTLDLMVGRYEGVISPQILRATILHMIFEGQVMSPVPSDESRGMADLAPNGQGFMAGYSEVVDDISISPCSLPYRVPESKEAIERAITEYGDSRPASDIVGASLQAMVAIAAHPDDYDTAKLPRLAWQVISGYIEGASTARSDLEAGKTVARMDMSFDRDDVAEICAEALLELEDDNALRSRISDGLQQGLRHALDTAFDPKSGLAFMPGASPSSCMTLYIAGFVHGSRCASAEGSLPSNDGDLFHCPEEALTLPLYERATSSRLIAWCEKAGYSEELELCTLSAMRGIWISQIEEEGIDGNDVSPTDLVAYGMGFADGLAFIFGSQGRAYKDGLDSAKELEVELERVFDNINIDGEDFTGFGTALSDFD